MKVAYMVWFERLDLESLAPFALANANSNKLIWLDSADNEHRLGRYSYVCLDPVRTFETWDAASMRAVMRRVAKSGSRTHNAVPPPPFSGGLVGVLNYEACKSILWKQIDRPADPSAVCYFGLYDTIIALDHDENSAWIISRGFSEGSLQPDQTRAMQRISDVLHRIEDCRASPLQPSRLEWALDVSKRDFVASVQQLQTLIEEGDLFQANLSQNLSALVPAACTPLSLYLAARRSNPAPFSAFAQIDDRAIISTSPERLIHADADGTVEARPIKGTIKRACDEQADAALQKALLESEKDRAENTMIVDLLRNDLSRVCEAASVEVNELCALESYAGLHQLTSSITAKLSADKDIFDLLEALVPGGSITGAPKTRSVEVIEALEQGPRGMFCGTLGYIGFDGASDFNILIRTIEVEGQKARLTVGAGITHLSEPVAEYEETLLKAERLVECSLNEEARDLSHQ
ncbi:MAG: anthranilate synthase component I family protein [Pseudomonadota bacterium]